jgi:hypothetical protein
VVDTELGREKDISILVTTIGRGLKPLDSIIDSQTRLN